MRPQYPQISPRQSEQFATREEVRTVVRVFTDMLDRKEKDPLRKLTFPTSLNTVCTIEFDGPVTIDDFDALLAHIAFYKTFMKEGVTLPNEYLSKSEMERIVMDALGGLREPSPTTT